MLRKVSDLEGNYLDAIKGADLYGANDKNSALCMTAWSTRAAAICAISCSIQDGCGHIDFWSPSTRFLRTERVKSYSRTCGRKTLRHSPSSGTTCC